MSISNVEYINTNIDKIISAFGTEPPELPVLYIENTVPFPAMTISLSAPTKEQLKAADSAIKNNQCIYLDYRNEEEPSAENKIGVIGTIKQLVFPKQLKSSIVIDCLCRAIPGERIKTGENTSAVTVCPVYEKPYDELSAGEEAATQLRLLRALFEKYAALVKNIDEKIVQNVKRINDCGSLTDFTAQYSYLSPEDKTALLCQTDAQKRTEQAIEIFKKEIEILHFQEELTEKLQRRFNDTQRDHYIREQISFLREELGDNADDPAAFYEEKIKKIKADGDIKDKLMNEASRLWNIPESAQEFSVITTYLDTCLDLPWGNYTQENFDLKNAETVLERDHHGLKKVKERILETLAVRKLTEENSGQILCLIGPPGIGKTSIAKSIAEACGRKFERISLGGVRDEAEIRGHRRTYIASMPGCILSAITHAKTMNPVILLDEVDKLSSDYKGDPSSALLEVLDPEQNKTFKDHYVDLPFDLSQVLFIATANVAENIPAPLLDRMDTIELTSYTHTEKFQIAKKHLLPKQLKKHGLTRADVSITDSAINQIIRNYTKEAGVRNLEKNLAALLRKTARKKLTAAEEKKITIGARNLKDYLGPEKYKENRIEKQDAVGVVNGLAYTTVGGELLPIEVSVLEGSGKIEMTGSLGNVMKESAQASVSYVRSKSDELKIDKTFYKTKDIHFHFPEGAIPKDGPSAGIGITTALISQLTNRKVKGDVAMTGEVTLRGNVLPIGGLREKSMAAYKAGIKTVIIPDDNLPDISELEEEVKQGLTFVPVKTMDEVLRLALR